MFRNAFLEQMKDQAIDMDFSSYEVRAVDTPPKLPECLDHLTFGNPKDLLDRIKGIDILMVHKAPVTSDVLEKADKLKAIGCARAGPGNVDIQKATEKNIPVFFGPGRNANAVAELTIGLIISEMRHLCRGQSWLRNGNWVNKSPPTQLFPGHELRGKVLGVVGLGHIGQIVAQIAKGFGMKVISFDPFIKSEFMNSLGVEPISFDDLLAKSDVVSLHVRLQEGQKHLIGKKELQKMKKTAYLINTSDGPVVDDDALFEALSKQEIAGAAQDSWYKKPVTKDNRWLGFDNTTVTPGLGGGTVEVPEHGIRMITEGIALFLRDQEPKYIKNPEVLLEAQTRTRAEIGKQKEKNKT
jgi:D-3-phosphoglycerate dehydrogenase